MNTKLSNARLGKGRLGKGGARTVAQFEQAGQIIRFASGIEAEVRIIRRSKKEPRVLRYSRNTDPGRSPSNPDGLPIVTILKVRWP